MADTSPTLPPPGWHADPEQPQTWRYWDGANWTDQRAPMAAPTAKRDTNIETIVALLVGLVFVIGLIFVLSLAL